MADLAAISSRFASNQRRQELCSGLVQACQSLADSGCLRLYVNGSFITGKPLPRDYDVCWDIRGVDPQALDPVFTQFADSRASQKAKFGGEFFPMNATADEFGRTFLEFFQIDRYSGSRKGIISVVLSDDPMLVGG